MEENNSPQTPATNQPPTKQPVKLNKRIVWLAGGLLIIILIVGGIYLFSGTQQTVVPNSQTTTLQAPKPAAEENLENDLSSIDVENGTESDFTSTDQDLQQL